MRQTSNNLELALARETAVQQGTMRGKAWSALSPRLTANASYVINNTEIALDFAESVPPEFAELPGRKLGRSWSRKRSSGRATDRRPSACSRRSALPLLRPPTS